MQQELEKKYDSLKNDIASKKRVIVAFSGGVDSTLLLQVAHDVLGSDAVAITVNSAFFPSAENIEANDFCSQRGIKHVTTDVDVLSDDRISSNPSDRCYVCKKKIFGSIFDAAKSLGIAHVLDGTNLDDMKDYRPGLKALEEMGVESPLKDAGLTKDEIRALSEELGLKSASKPAMACLATRFPTDTLITKEKLDAVEKAEEFLRYLGFMQLRVRTHEDLARIEVPVDQMDAFFEPEMRSAISQKLRSLGFRYVTLDISGYKMGNMNEP